ncbi:MAG: hypothetical protein ABJL99_15810 [Aliishimia sp.]
MPDIFSAAIRDDLPNVPDEVLHTWLAPHAARSGLGWPPAAETPWHQLLMGRPLSWWQACNWSEERLPMHLDLMASVVRFQVEQLLKTAMAGRDLMPDSQSRIDAMETEIASKGTWPVALVGFPDADGLGLADGYHRLAALTRLRRNGEHVAHDAHRIWVAVTPA